MRPDELQVDKYGNVFWLLESPPPANVIRFRAEDVRKEKTGVHANIVIYERDTVLAYDTFNVQRHADRIRIGNAAYALLTTPNKEGIKKEDFQHEIDLFCRHAWPQFLSSFTPEMMAGDGANNPLTFLAAPHIVSGGGTILYGKGESGKSWTMMFMAVAVDAGVNGFWHTQQSKVLFVNIERSRKSVARRLESINLSLGLEPDRPIFTLNARGKTLADIADIIDKAVEKQGVELVAVDSLSRAGMGDLNENKAGNNFSDLMNRIAPSWIAIGHVPRNDDKHIYGSVMFENAADVMVRFRSEKQTNKLGTLMEITKGNDLPDDQKRPLCLEYDFDEWGVRGIRHGNLADFPTLTLKDNMPLADQILHYLRDEAGRDSATSIARTLNAERAYVAQILTKDSRFSRVGKAGKEVFYAVAANVSPEES